MRYDTHLATTIAAGATVSFFQSDVLFSYLYVIGLAIGSLLPDIDEPNSFLGRRVRVLSKPIKRIFGHRGVTHSVLTWLLLVYFLYPTDSLFITGFLIGYSIHLLGDLFSKRSIPLFAPFSRFRLKMPVTYEISGIFENTLLLASVIYTIILIQKGSLLGSFL
ncbi:metal-dependent hydrolase [Alteribacter populi]|uniref:metal-dependent hydrolase n=1 Tax=Alteribacter populi TaxID=2011011 RepID=UPI0012FE2A61|nr:metal-dependent hydrolase [Alteribacter populi]